MEEVGEIVSAEVEINPLVRLKSLQGGELEETEKWRRKEEGKRKQAGEKRECRGRSAGRQLQNVGK